MDEKNGKNPLFALTVATVFFAALGVMVYNPSPYKGNRPSVPQIQESPEKIRARLWQDPFQAVLDGVKATEKSQTPQVGDKQTKTTVSNRKTKDKKDKSQKGVAGTCVTLLEQTQLPEIEGKLAELNKEISGYGNVTVLGVMVQGGSYDDNIESRIGQRYAVLSALDVLGFYPDDPIHIDFLKICPSSTEKQTDYPYSLLNIIPFEWLDSNEHDKHILLLWLNEESFKNKPLTKLDNLRIQLSSQPFKVIGPATSTILLDMIKENKEINWKIYSATATADKDLLEEGAKEGTNQKKNPSKVWANINRTILPDRELAKELIRELRLRDVDLTGNKPTVIGRVRAWVCGGLSQVVNPLLTSSRFTELTCKKNPDHVVLVAEWDTVYGRSLPETFKNVIRDELHPGFKGKIDWVHRYSYLRGIDGKLPGEPNGSAKEQNKTKDSSKGEGDIKQLEEPVGKSQYDYLRRLAERIGRLDDQLIRTGQGPIKAIGVLGNDFYDKFLVLQALGQRFPDRIFFTTDLDARYLHPANIEWTRNLVVASAFGLQLRDDLQGEVPPFRNGYQTSVFFATLRAFYGEGNIKNNPLKPEDVNRELSPRIFEIGRYHAVDLSERSENSPPINQALASEGFGLKFYGKIVGLIIISSILLMLLWLCCTSETTMWGSIKQFIKKPHQIPVLQKETNIFFIWLISLAVFLGLFLIFQKFIMENSLEEPFSLSEGISVWPAEIIRLFAIILSLMFFKLTAIWLKKNKDTIAEDFSLTKDPANNPDDTASVNREWGEYLERSGRDKRLRPVIVITTVYFLLCIFIIIIFEMPTTPVRGDWSGRINWVILMSTIILFLILTFLVLDVIMQCQRFIAKSYGGELPQWSQDSQDKFMQKWVKDPDLWRKSAAKDVLNDWMLIQLIAKRTDVVGKLIFFPFIVWFLIFVSRTYYFDHWRTPYGLAIVISLSALLAWSCAVYLRRSAEKLRTVVVNRLSQQLVGAYAAESPSRPDVDRIQYVLAEVKAIKTGAFASYFQQPVLQSLLVPLGGVSGLKVLEFLASLG